MNEIDKSIGEEPKEANQINESKDVKEAIDEYAYLERDEFCSEKFKIEIKNLPKFYGIQQLRKLLNETLKLNSSKLKTPRKNCPYAFVCFRNDEDRENAIKMLKNYKWKGHILNAITAKPSPDPLFKKRKENESSSSPNKKLKSDNRNIAEQIKDSVIPYWNVPYEEQLVKKQEAMKQILRKIGNDLAHQNPSIRKWLNEQKTKYNGLPCELMEIKYAEKYDGYRNKCEFTVGINPETDEKCVGNRIGSYVNGITGVGPVEDLRHISDTMKVAVKKFEKFVQNSNLDVFRPEDNSGNFRQLSVRTAKTQLMLIVGIYPKNLTDENVKKLKDDLIDYFFVGEGKEANVTSLYYQPLFKKVNNEDESNKPEHLHGNTHIYETIFGLKFRISPEAFFQVNTDGAEVLYKAAMELAGSTEESTILDICCGTGTIGLCFAKSSNQILGLELVPEAIEDAKLNALENKIENAEFYAGKAEEILQSVFMRARNSDIIAVVDPPRAGLHNKAITSLRKIKNLKKLIYISCNPKQAIKNFVDLGRAESKTMHGEPLVPTKAVAVDMFPHTSHCELILFFQRINTLQTI